MKSKAIALLAAAALSLSSCNMGAYYAHKRIGDTNEKQFLAESQKTEQKLPEGRSIEKTDDCVKTEQMTCFEPSITRQPDTAKTEAPERVYTTGKTVIKPTHSIGRTFTSGIKKQVKKVTKKINVPVKNMSRQIFPSSEGTKGFWLDWDWGNITLIVAIATVLLCLILLATGAITGLGWFLLSLPLIFIWLYLCVLWFYISVWFVYILSFAWLFDLMA